MAGQILVQRGAGSIGGGGSGTPGGSNTQVQYNDGGAFGGDAGLTFDETTDLLTVVGGLDIDSDAGLLRLGAAQDVILARDAANVLAQRNGTNAQTFRVYGTFSDASNYERLAISATAGTSVTIAAETAGTGADNLDININPIGTGIAKINGNFRQEQSGGKTFEITDNGNAQVVCQSGTFKIVAVGGWTWSAHASNAYSGAADVLLNRNGAAGQLLLEDKLIVKESTADPSAANLTSGANAKDRLAFYMKNDKLVFAYNNAGTVTYVTLDLDGSDTTWAHNTTAP